MKTIFKYRLLISDRQVVNLPRGATILSAGLDPAGELCLWAAVDTDNPKQPREILIFGTGHLLPDIVTLRFIGTVNQGPFMWHVFEVYSH